MKKFNFKIKNVKLAFVILIILCLALVFAYYYFVLNDSIYRDNYANQMIGISDNNENTIFSIQKVVLYSNANAIDNSKDQSLSDVSICQYSDLGISIDNSQSSSELTDENTVKQLYIDNIVMTSKLDKGTKILNYKNPFSFGKYKEIESPINNRIDFKIISTNKENESNNYDEPTFFTDCSNPINLGYLNKDLLTKYSVSNESSTVSFNGKVLKEAVPDVKIVAVEPKDSQTLGKGEKGPHKIQGIGAGFVPSIYDASVIDEIIPVENEDAGNTLLALAKEEGIFSGISSGAATWAALDLAKKEENKGKRIIAILPDNGERYLSVEWLFD